MSERAALYAVSVRRRRGRAVPLADIDGAGTALAAVLAAILDGLSVTSRDGARVVRTLAARADGDDLFAIVQHGRRGVAADIVDPSGGVRLRQTPDDLQLVRSGCLFRLPASGSAGRLAVQVSNGRGVKDLFEVGLTARFRARFPDLTLALDRIAEPDALRDAVAQDRVERIQLVRVERAGEHAIAATDKWVPAGESVRVELAVGVHGPGARLGRTLLGRYLGGDEHAFSEIVAFGGLTFDKARIGVRLPDDTRRLIDLEHPEAGRPAVRDLAGIVLDDAGEPTEASLLAALRAVVDS
jgi:hypothetical protein